jgi:hypothetical protein
VAFIKKNSTISIDFYGITRISVFRYVLKVRFQILNNALIFTQGKAKPMWPSNMHCPLEPRHGRAAILLAMPVLVSYNVSSPRA